MASQGSCEQSAAHLGGWGTGAGQGFPFPRVRARRESLQVGRAQGHCPGPSGVGQPAALEPLPRMRGRRAQPGSASRPRAGGLQGRVPSYYKQYYNEHEGTCVSFNSYFLGVYAQQWDCWVI